MSTNDGFFAIDRRVWPVACGLGIPAAVAYLVMARGTLRDMRTSAWSVNAIEKYTGIGRPRAQKAIATLISSGLVRQDRGGSHPLYYLLPAAEVPGTAGAHAPLTDEETRIFGIIAAGNHNVPKIGQHRNVWGYGKPYETACSLMQKGWLKQSVRGGHYFELADRTAEPPPDDAEWVWLPNALVDGAAGETPPIEMVRQTQNPAALRLFIDLYHTQNLASDGGLHWQGHIRQKWSRQQIGQRGPLVVWGVRKGVREAWHKSPVVAPHMTGRYEPTPWDATKTRDSGYAVFWPALEALEALGLVEMVGHVVEADTEDAEILHPFATGELEGESVERDIMRAAQRASWRLLTQAQVDWAVAQDSLWLLPAPAHMQNIAVVGIARLRYRPRTKTTAAWMKRQEEWARWVQVYEAMGQEQAAGSGSRQDMQHQRISTGHQR